MNTPSEMWKYGKWKYDGNIPQDIKIYTLERSSRKVQNISTLSNLQINCYNAVSKRWTLGADAFRKTQMTKKHQSKIEDKEDELHINDDSNENIPNTGRDILTFSEWDLTNRIHTQYQCSLPKSPHPNGR